MIFLLPKADERKRLFKRKAIKNEEIILNDEASQIFYICENDLNDNEFIEYLQNYKGEIISHRKFKENKTVKPLLSDISKYKKLCVFLSLYKYLKSGKCKNEELSVIDNDGVLIEKIELLLPFVKKIKIISESDLYNEDFINRIYNEYGTKVPVLKSRQKFCGKCCADFDYLTNDGTLILSLRNQCKRIEPAEIQVVISGDIEKLLNLGINKIDLYGSYYKI